MMLFLEFFTRLEQKYKNRRQFLSASNASNEFEIKNYYAFEYRKAMSNVKGFSNDEKMEILGIISISEGGILNLDGYKNRIYDQFFKGRSWVWIEYNIWHTKFLKLGKFPRAFQGIATPVTLEVALNMLSSFELRAILRAHNINVNLISRKNELVALAKNISGIAELKSVKLKIAEAQEKVSYNIYLALMFTIACRTKSRLDYQNALRLGVKKFERVYPFEDDKEFAHLVLNKNPRALPPYFPCDLSSLKPILES